ncbi:site-specific recombinase XerD [Sulfitobacter mediterraneus]|uniref:Site-specific recombinase XerD n=1 Tax=Sulfitobacter mediterraneus TaxID=83219 RepID=A0A2T6C0Q0_9RHOB|nr:Phage integrase family protein [Sulfitobacter mediterraneus KCTC 32188]PTX61891.1 site-specific recombinase XerD [Sulfitobacter mediterraneus]
MKHSSDYSGLCRERTPAGTTRWRVRVEGNKTKKISLPFGPDHDDFRMHYLAGREGRKLEALPQTKVMRGTLDEMCNRFILWMDQQVIAGNLSLQTVSSRQRGLSQACGCLSPKGLRIGSLKADLPREAFVAIRDSFGPRTGAADTCLKALRAVYKWGEDYGYPENSKVFQIRSNHRPKGGAKPWSKEDREQFLRQHGAGTMARRWFLLAFDTAGRIGDTFSLGPQHLRLEEDRMFLAWQPKKRGSQPVKVPLSEELLEELATVLDDDQTFLSTDYGKPFASSGSLDNRVRKWIIQAGLYDLIENELGEVSKKANRSQHGIRKAKAQEIAEQGGTVYEVMACLSHSDPKTAAIYTKLVDRERLAKKAAERVEAGRGNERVPRSEDRGALDNLSVCDQTDILGKWQPVGESNPSFQVENLTS